MGIKITNTKIKAEKTLGLVNKINSFLFEEEYGELSRYFKDTEKEKLRKICKMLMKICEKSIR